jgi:AraC-like DNA-binding protein
VVATQKYIEKNYSDPNLTLEDIAGSVGISLSYLSKLYSDCLGVRLLDYLTHYRVDASMDMLLQTRQTILDISEKCGFASSRNYIRAFKKYYEVTPGEYRRAHSTTPDNE